MENNWYILKVVSGQEKKISSRIDSLLKEEKILIDEVFVPFKKVTKIKRGKKIEDQEKLFSGYVFVKFDLNINSQSSIVAIPKVSGFLGGKNPTAVSKSKMDDIFNMVSNNNVVAVDNEKIFRIGEIVNVIDGSFDSFSGSVESFDIEKERVKISISIFGRLTSVELHYYQVKKQG
jgi:transcriptional antiterminator NusG